jgi:hypothetical protein
MGWFRRNEHDHEQLSAYLDGELDSRQAETVESHLATCDACAALLEELRGGRALLASLPAQTSGRSFVLGSEYARAPVRDAPPSRRLSLALAPAVALSVFIALLFVDLAGNQSGSSDESTSALTAASSRQADDASAGAGSAGSVGAPPSADSAANSTFEADAGVDKADGEQPGVPAPTGVQDAPAAAGAAQAEAPLRSSGLESTPAVGEAAAVTAADEAPVDEDSPEPLTAEAPDDDGDGISTLRVLQVVAVAAFLASGIYVFVWPRVSRGGS